jgi:5'-nucleotidase/UDP-sugar diphosphatase
MRPLKKTRIFRLSILFIFLAFLFINPTSVFAKTYQLTILHTNDHHGHFEKFNSYPVSDVGGFAAQSALVNIVRAEVEKKGGQTLLLSAGDVNTGVPESDMLDAEPDFKLMNLIGYDAMTVGNHEFDKSLDVLMKQKGWAEFPFLAANIVKKGTGETLFEPYIIKDLDGLRVAIFGLITEETPILVVPDHVKDLEFKSTIETAKALVPKLRKEADLVIALTHIGFYEESGGKYKAPGVFRLAREVQGIDAIVDGHSHTAVKELKKINNTVLVQAGEWSKYVGRLDLTVDTDLKRVTGSQFKLIPVNMKKRVKYKGQRYYAYVDVGYIEDKAILKAMEPYLEKADSVLSQPIGKALVKLDGDRKLVRSQETNLANLVTDGMRAKTGADIAFQNAGGIRADVAPGVVTYRDVLKVQPFGNTLVVMYMTGKQIIDVLNYAATIKPGNGAYLQVSGLKWTNNKGKPENVIIGSAPVDPNKTYKAVTNSFMAAGGDGYSMLKKTQQVDTGFVDADALREYFAKSGEVNPKVEGRVTVIR